MNVSSVIPSLGLGGLFCGSLKNGLTQSTQEALMQLVPKAGVNGLIRNSGVVIADEATIELGEYFALYFLPSLLGIFLARLTQIFNQKDLEPSLIGQRVYDLEKELGKTYVTRTNKKILINKELICKISRVKVFNNMAVVLGVICVEMIAGAIRPILIDKIFKTHNFYTISGLETKSEEVKNNKSIKQAYKNIKDALIIFCRVLPAIFGFQLLSGAIFKNHTPEFFRGLVRHFDLDSNFGISRTILALTLPSAAFAYNMPARNLAESVENCFRMFFFSWGAILFFKQILATFFGLVTGLLFGAGNIIGNPWKTWSQETFGKEKGKRDLLDFDFVDLKRKRKPSNNPIFDFCSDFRELVQNKVPDLTEFSGRITKLKRVKALPPRTQAKFLQYTHLVKEHLPIYVFALPVGAVFAYLNYQRTKKCTKTKIINRPAGWKKLLLPQENSFMVSKRKILARASKILCDNPP